MSYSATAEGTVLASATPSAPAPSASSPSAALASNDIAISFRNVTKTYKLYENNRGRLKSLLFSNDQQSHILTMKANDNLSFDIRRGEAVAFIGHNGAGKSTALKMITGVSFPTSGDITVNGRVSALLELTAGFDNQLTGRENIHLRGSILGMSKEEIAIVEPHIIDFADLGVYIDQPVKNYSSGMRARLGFAIAVAVDPEILVIDEALSVGDRAFQRKCTARIHEIMANENVTVLFVTHASAAAKEFCTRGIVLDKGTKVFDGEIDKAIKFYEENY